MEYDKHHEVYGKPVTPLPPLHEPLQPFKDASAEWAKESSIIDTLKLGSQNRADWKASPMRARRVLDPGCTELFLADNMFVMGSQAACSP